MEKNEKVEETTKEEEKTEGEETPSDNIVDRAEAANKALDEKLKQLEEAQKKLDTAKAEQLLAGTGGGGTEKQEAKKEETPAEYAKRVMRNEL